MDVFTLEIRRQRFFEFQLLNSRQFTVIKLKYKSHLILKKTQCNSQATVGKEYSSGIFFSFLKSV